MSPEIARSARATHSYLGPLPERIDGRGNLEPEHEKSSSKSKNKKPETKKKKEGKKKPPNK